MKFKIFLHTLTVLVVALLCFSCADDMIIDNGPDGDGNTTVSASVEFTPMVSGLDGGSRTSGSALKSISKLNIIVFSQTGKFLKNLPIANFSAETTTDRPELPDGIPADKHWAESNTSKVSLNFNLAYGRYRIYAVANVPGIDTFEDDEEDLKNLSLTWKTDDILANGAMLGHFSLDKTLSNKAPDLVISRPQISLNAWLKRAASKVTVAFDGTELEEGVFIYLKSVQIKDIPATCLLGNDNTPTKNDQLIADGEMVKFYAGEIEPDESAFNSSYPVRITKGNPKYGNHDEDSPNSMFFFENMQGKGVEGTASDKRQLVKGDEDKTTPSYPGGNTKPEEGNASTDPNFTGFKDAKPYGSYIEVKAYYQSNAFGHVTKGNIVYRFMLGKDVITDYNAERNHHYKLTLKFKKWANDVDWHIDYTPEPGLSIPNPYYISYLYNHSMMLPVTINAGSNTIKSVHAEITDNRWAPKDAAADFDYVRELDLEGHNLWNGFLSLHKTVDRDLIGTPPYKATSNQAYWDQTPKRGLRTYTKMEPGSWTDGLDEESAGIHVDDKYDVAREVKAGQNLYHLSLPMYTRAKVLIKGTSYTGSNPYMAYPRSAKVKIVATLSDNSTLEDEVEIIQVRRVENPKGVYREYDNTTPFHVVLTHLPKENATKFEKFTSEGRWRAYVIGGDENLVNLSGSGLEKSGGTVFGSTGSYIDFNINFNKTVSVGENESKYAIIRVDYHDYTCNHLIFVRRGLAPDNLVEGGAKWHAKNLKTNNKETDSPTEEGSLFRYAVLGGPIDATSNRNPKEYWNNVVPSDFITQTGSESLVIASDDDTNHGSNTWTGLSSRPMSSDTFDNSYAKLGNTFSDSKIPEVRDFAALYKSDHIQQGFGVLYGDDADETLLDINEVYGRDYTTSSKYGMRGVFVYNNAASGGFRGKNVFFPIGASGYGHRKHSENGLLRYSCQRKDYFDPQDAQGKENYPDGKLSAPLFYDLFMRPGAIYWTNGPATDDYFNKISKGDGTNIHGWDINYFTFDFYPIVRSNLCTNASGWGTADACFIRLVDK